MLCGSNADYQVFPENKMLRREWPSDGLVSHDNILSGVWDILVNWEGSTDNMLL